MKKKFFCVFLIKKKVKKMWNSRFLCMNIGGSRGARAPLSWEKFGWFYRESLKHDWSGPPLGKVLDPPLMDIWIGAKCPVAIMTFALEKFCVWKARIDPEDHIKWNINFFHSECNSVLCAIDSMIFVNQLK